MGTSGAGVRDDAGMSDEPILDPATQRGVAVHLYNRTWDLLDLGDQRTEAQTQEMVDAAHASSWHWRRSAVSSRPWSVPG